MSIKVRIMGTERECDAIVDYFSAAFQAYPFFKIRSISDFYPNRGKTIEGRVYVEVERI